MSAGMSLSAPPKNGEIPGLSAPGTFHASAYHDIGTETTHNQS